MTAPRQHPILAFAVALASVGVLSIMDAVMKALVLAIGLYATTVWRSLVGLVMSSILYLPRRRPSTSDAANVSPGGRSAKYAVSWASSSS